MDYKDVQSIVFVTASEICPKDGDERLTTTLSLDTTFMDLEFDSLSGAEFASALSDRMGFEVPEGELCSLRGNSSQKYMKTSLKEVIDYIVENQERLRTTPNLP